jgi:lipopolysaccharide/colanic/teichoic acid biosynthesis glycosyltransferase
MRRAIDIVVGVAALAALAPLLALVALAVAIDSPGSPFYRGRRAGKDGRVFRMWKFRTMVRGADKMSPITGGKDARVTRLGGFLRKSKLDELPQFLNVVLGDMTLVGPRPEAPELVAGYTPEQRAVLAVKPGITGRVQLDSGDEAAAIPAGAAPDEYYRQYLMDRKIREDLDYLSVRTPGSDARIVLETAGYVLRALTGK